VSIHRRSNRHHIAAVRLDARTSVPPASRLHAASDRVHGYTTVIEVHTQRLGLLPNTVERSSPRPPTLPTRRAAGPGVVLVVARRECFAPRATPTHSSPIQLGCRPPAPFAPPPSTPASPSPAPPHRTHWVICHWHITVWRMLTRKQAGRRHLFKHKRPIRALHGAR